MANKKTIVFVLGALLGAAFVTGNAEAFKFGLGEKKREDNYYTKKILNLSPLPPTLQDKGDFHKLSSKGWTHFNPITWLWDKITLFPAKKREKKWQQQDTKSQENFYSVLPNNQKQILDARGALIPPYPYGRPLPPTPLQKEQLLRETSQPLEEDGYLVPNTLRHTFPISPFLNRPLPPIPLQNEKLLRKTSQPLEEDGYLVPNSLRHTFPVSPLLNRPLPLTPPEEEQLLRETSQPLEENGYLVPNSLRHTFPVSSPPPTPLKEKLENPLYIADTDDEDDEDYVILGTPEDFADKNFFPQFQKRISQESLVSFEEWLSPKISQ